MFNMKDMKNITRTVVLDEEFAPSGDIRRYLEDELFRIFTKRNISPLTSNEDIHCLVSKASGQFIYASTIIKFIDDDDCNPREQLDIILKLRTVNSSSPYAPLDQLYIQILAQQPDIRFLRDVFVLIIALGDPNFKFICRRLQISEENLRAKLRRMHSLLRIEDLYITVYHRSLHDFFRDKKRAGKYHVHPMRVTLVQLPERSRRFAKRLWNELGYPGAVLATLGLPCLYIARISLAPLFIIPGLCFGMYFRSVSVFINITLHLPLLHILFCFGIAEDPGLEFLDPEN